jgi:hypothetical protein
MKSLVAAVAMILVTQSAFAGEGAASILCRSKTGKTKLSYWAADGGDMAFDLSLTAKNGEKLKVSYVNADSKAEIEMNGKKLPANTKLAPIVSIVQPQTIAVVVTGDSAYMGNQQSLISIPGTVKSVKSEYGEKYLFKAKVGGVDPRTGEYMNEIEVTCVYEYSI